LVKIDKDIKALLADAYASTLVCSKMFYPDRFYRPFGPIHKEICDLLDNRSLQKKAIEAPRGIGKTSLVVLAYATKKILFREARFIIIVSSSNTAAENQAENLKDNLLESPLIRKLFGSFKSARWSREMWVVEWSDGFKTLVFPRGAGQQVRGSLFGDHRPDLIIVDDLENDEEVLSEEQRKKKREWFFSSLCNCVDRGSKSWEIVYIDTLKHEDCLLQRLLDADDWASLRLAMGDENLNSNWPEFMSTLELKALHDEYRANGEADVFYREYMGLPISGEDAGFHVKFFKYFNEMEEFGNSRNDIESFVIVDPAKTVNPRSAKTAILGGSVCTSGQKVMLRDLVNDFLHPNEAMEKAFEMCRSLKARVLAVEVTSLHEFITFPWKNEILRRGLPIEFIELHARGKKEHRAKALIPMYRRGQIEHNDSGVMEPLEQQQLSFPRPRRWDCLDACAYVVELLDIGGRYFDPDGGKDDSKAKIEAEFKELEDEYEEPMEEEDWAPKVSFSMEC